MEYNLKSHKKFVKDMEKAGLEPRFYQGRYYWRGPAVSVSDLQEAMSNTKVKCQWDSLGRGYIVYPVESDSSLSA